jgi:hypothetical protein
MQTYGPWNMGHRRHMDDLAFIILCLAFEVAFDMARTG